MVIITIIFSRPTISCIDLHDYKLKLKTRLEWLNFDVRLLWGKLSWKATILNRCTRTKCHENKNDNSLGSLVSQRRFHHGGYPWLIYTE